MTDTWNFPCYTCNDWGSFETTRGAHGMAWWIETNQPFTDTITGVFSFFMRSGWTDVAGTISQIYTSIGNASGTKNGLLIYIGAISGDYRLIIETNDASAGTAFHEIQLGDEDGVNWLQADKWYQVAFSVSASAFTYAVNGTNTPKLSVISSTNGDMALTTGARIMHLSGNTAESSLASTNLLLANANWPTFVAGACAWSTTYVDWTDATARGRVFDADGNFKNPGENGSLWFGAYDVDVPEFYFLDGSPRRDNGFYNATIPQDWDSSPGGGAGSVTAPGGLRKQYENAYPDDWWIYRDLATAEASGDTWIDGDTIFIATTSVQFLYKAALVVEGYSGLIHKYPYGRLYGLLGSCSVKGSEAENSDPDTWTNYTKTGVGTQGVDYELDTNAGLSRLRALTDAGYVWHAATYACTATEAETFRIIDNASMTKSGGNDQVSELAVTNWIDASNHQRARVAVFGGSTWSYEYTSGGTLDDSGRTNADARRIWLYVKDGRCAIWFDDDGAPVNASASRSTPANVASGSAPIAATNVGYTTAGVTYEAHIGIDIFGSMTTS